MYHLQPHQKSLLGLAADFAPSYAIVSVNEGGYANVSNDKGRETYAGISRRYHPNAEIWVHIDTKKNRYAGGIIPHNTRFPDLDFIVERFYRGLYDGSKFGELVNQSISNLLFDFYVHSGSTAIKTVQRLVGVTQDGIMGPITRGAINAANPSQLHDALKAERKKFLQKLIDEDPSQQDFEKNWMARVARFPTLVTTSVKNNPLPWIIGGVAVGGLILLMVNSSKKKKPKQKLKLAA